jgi:hypothetical protein
VSLQPLGPSSRGLSPSGLPTLPATNACVGPTVSLEGPEERSRCEESTGTRAVHPAPDRRRAHLDQPRFAQRPRTDCQAHLGHRRNRSIRSVRVCANRQRLHIGGSIRRASRSPRFADHSKHLPNTVEQDETREPRPQRLTAAIGGCTSLDRSTPDPSDSCSGTGAEAQRTSGSRGPLNCRNRSEPAVSARPDRATESAAYSPMQSSGQRSSTLLHFPRTSRVDRQCRIGRANQQSVGRRPCCWEVE